MSQAAAAAFSLLRMVRNRIPRVRFCFVPQNGISSCFLFCWRIGKGILRVFFYFFPQNGISSCFLFFGRVRNEIPRIFSSAEQPEFRRKYLYVPSIPSSTELFFCPKFPTLPSPTQLGEGGPLEGVGPETHVPKTHNIHYRIQTQNTKHRIQITE